MTDTLTRQIETVILRKTVEAVLAEPGVTGIHVWDGGDEEALYNCSDIDQITEVAFAVDECEFYIVRPGHKTQWIRFIWNNGDYGLTCVSDYTVGLDDALKPVYEWCGNASSALDAHLEGRAALGEPTWLK